ncbi:MAG: YifB family Mg chelatase-like AAA ATPase [Planctomycetota bacterium]
MQRVQTFALRGIDAQPVEVECDERAPRRSSGPEGSEEPRGGISIVGLPDASVREAVTRVRAALSNSELPTPRGNCTINLAPADLRKEGPLYDLPIALAVLRMQGVLDDDRDGMFASFGVAGELALDGFVRPIRGSTSFAAFARDHGLRGIVVPAANAPEAAAVRGISVHGVSSLAEAVAFFAGKLDIPPEREPEECPPPFGAAIDLADVRGQEAAKRALAIAAAGGHNALLIGPAGSGKTMMARAMPGILPPLTPDEALEVTRIYSAVGAVPRGAGLIRERPFRAPHHTASSAAIVGGGSVPRPGEVSLAHHGVLFLDELPEFPRVALECLREPLEDGFVTIARAQGTLRFPARTMLVAAMNPSHAGGFAGSASERRAQDKYIGRLSGPLLDRIDLHVEVRAVPFAALQGARRGASSADLRGKVLEARGRMELRQGRGRPNARLSGRDLDRVAELEPTAQRMLEGAMRDLGLSARAYDRIRRVSRTIADLDAAERVGESQVAEALHYRVLDRMRAQEAVR